MQGRTEHKQWDKSVLIEEAVKRLLNLETWSRKTQVMQPKSGQPLQNSHYLNL